MCKTITMIRLESSKEKPNHGQKRILCRYSSYSSFLVSINIDSNNKKGIDIMRSRRRKRVLDKEVNRDCRRRIIKCFLNSSSNNNTRKNSNTNSSR